MRVIGGLERKIALTGLAGTEVDGSSYSFDGIPIGKPTTDRLIVVAVRNYTAFRTVNSVSVGGLALTKYVQVFTSELTIWARKIAAGETATIVIGSGGGNFIGMDIMVWAAHRILSATPVDTKTDISAPMSQTMIPDEDGVLVAAGAVASTGTVAWTGADNDGRSFGLSGASKSHLVNDNHTVSAVATGTSWFPGIGMATWR